MTLHIDRCVCTKQTFAELSRLATESGWDLPELARCTEAGLHCGLCRPYLRQCLRTGQTVFAEIHHEPADADLGDDVWRNVERVS